MGMWRRKKRRWFIPKYDELTIFMMTVALLLLFLFDNSFRSKVVWLVVESGRDAFRVVILILFFLAGGLLSVYHVFTERSKTKIEKGAMLFFAVMTNALCGLLASGHILDNWGDAPGILIVFPLWNGINCVLLVILLRVGVINETSVTDENARSGEVIFGFVIAL
jgi:peptidoglycan/LPS O-acetylase OafA/YrhL